MSSSKTPMIVGLAFVALTLLVIVIIIGAPGFNIQVKFDDLNKIRRGDNLYMNGQVIGTITGTKLKSPGEGIIKVNIKNQYKDFLNQSTIFTIAGDKFITGRKCLLSKNRDQSAQPVESGHVYEGVGRIEFELVRLTDGAGRIWNGYLKDMAIESIDKTGKLSKDVMDKIKELERENHDEIVGFMDQLKKEVENLTPELKKQIDELMRGF